MCAANSAFTIPNTIPISTSRLLCHTSYTHIHFCIHRYQGTTSSSITVDLSPLNGAVPTAVRYAYAWGVPNCCDITDPTTFTSKDCIANCPVMSSSGLPANPFIAKIAGGKCKCVPPRRSAMCKYRGAPAKAGHKIAAGSRYREAPTAARGGGCVPPRKLPKSN